MFGKILEKLGYNNYLKENYVLDYLKKIIKKNLKNQSYLILFN